MKQSLSTPLIGLSACLALGALAFPSLSIAVQDDGVAEEDGSETVLAEQMEVLESHLAKLRRTLRDEELRDESLAHIAGIQAAVVASKAEAPVMLPSIPEGERAAFQTAYRREMVGMLMSLCDLEVAVLDGETDQARTIFKAIRKMEDDGHERFTEDG